MFSSKQFEKAWRPSLHCVLVLVHGVAECYYVMDHDCKKNSDMNLTAICRSLDHVKSVLDERGTPMQHNERTAQPIQLHVLELGDWERHMAIRKLHVLLARTFTQ